MSQPKQRRAANALPFRKPDNPRVSEPERIHAMKLDCERLREKLTRSVMDNPQLARKAALLIGLWIEGKTKKRKSA